MTTPQLEMYVFVQDNCPICASIKKTLDITTSAKSTLAGIPIYKVYPTTETIKEYNIKAVPTTIIVEVIDNQRILHYKEEGLIQTNLFIDYIKTLQNGGRLSTPLSY